MNLARAIETVSLWEVLQDRPTPDFGARQLIYWYAEKFSTPPHLVEALPLEYLLQVYHEVSFLAMDEEDRHAAAKRLAMSEAEEAAASTKAERDAIEDRRFEEDAKVEARAAITAEAAIAAAEAAAALTQLQGKSAEQRQLLDELAREGVAIKPGPRVRPGAEVELPKTQAAPPISMQFISLEELDRMSEQDTLGQLPEE